MHPKVKINLIYVLNVEFLMLNLVIAEIVTFKQTDRRTWINWTD